MSSKWILDRQTTIYSRVKAMTLAKFKNKYSDINITSDDSVNTIAKFPNVFITFLAPIEMGTDLEGKSINAVEMTVQVEITVTKTQGMSVANEIAWEILDMFKGMSFEATMPTFDGTISGTDTYRTIARYSRIIGYNDTI